MNSYKFIPAFDARAQDRFWEFADMPSDLSQCWPWRGSKWLDGYGQFRGFAAHRVAYTIANRPIPDGLTIDHRCGNRACVNPGHLEAITARENLRRRVQQPVVSYPVRKRTADRYRRRRERGTCVQCNTLSAKYRCEACGAAHNAKMRAARHVSK